MSLYARIPNWVKDVVTFVIVVAAGLAPIGNPARAVFGSFDAPNTFGGSVAFAIVVVVIPALMLPLRRRWPLAIVVTSLGFFGVGVILGSTGPGAVLASAIAMFGLAVRRNRRTTIIVAIVAVICTTALLLLVGGPFIDMHAIQVGVTIGFAAAAGDATRSRHAYIAAITDRAVRAEETRESEARRRVAEDRLRIAQDLHDVVAHEIAVISLNAGVASTTMESKPETAKEALANIRGAARTVLGEISDLLTTLRLDPDGSGSATGSGGSTGAGRGSDSRIAGGAGAGTGTGTGTGTGPNAAASPTAPTPGLDRLDALIARFAENGLDVTTRREGDPLALPAATDVVAYRIIQEALTNAHKHGHSGRAHVRVQYGADSVEIVVTNPIVPSSKADDDATRPGHGLQGIRERVQSVRGTVEVQQTRTGFRLHAVLPVDGRTA